MRHLTPLLLLALAGCPAAEQVDGDLDGYTEAEGDCNDEIAGISPAQTDIVGDGIDQNCDGVDGTDLDRDGFASIASGGDDCDDSEASTYVGADEIPNDDSDQDCNGVDRASDSFLFEAATKADLLFVLDDSCSMSEEQGKLIFAIPELLDALDTAGTDYQIGVVTTDMDDWAKRGKLQADDWSGLRFVTPDTPELIDVLGRIFDVGIEGSADEKGLAALYAAVETHGDTQNADFFRDDAHLATIVLTDEDDYSGDTPITVEDFITWYENVSPISSSFHAIMGLDPPCTDAWEHGARYQQVIDSIGGEVASICDTDYATFMNTMGSYLDGAAPIVLSRAPAPGTIQVFVTPPGGEKSEWTEGWTYIPNTNRIGFDDKPEADSEIEVLYDLVPPPL